MNDPSHRRLLSRRHFLLFSASGLLPWMLSNTIAVAQAAPKAKMRRSLLKPKPIGTTFSQLQCQYIGLDYQETFRQICALGFQRIRLCGYWSEIEAVENKFDFTVLDWLLKESHRHGIEVILTVGMKAPRWAEFHFPNWIKARYNTNDASAPLDQNAELADLTLRMINQVVRHTRFAPALKYWQVENEPFTGMEITAGRRLSPEFVGREVALVRSLARPDQKILLTNAISLPDGQSNEDDRAFAASLALADAVGINVYTKVPQGETGSYLEPLPAYWEKLGQWQQMLRDRGKEAWIGEAQAEPWEPRKLVALDQADYPSTSPQQVSAIVESVHQLDYRTVLLWGCEYWYWHQKNGRDQWWQYVQQLLDQG